MGVGWGTPRTDGKKEVRFADPYKKCRECGGWVDGCSTGRGGLTLIPCGHHSDYEDLCPSWSPVNGCDCKGFTERHPDNPMVHEVRPPTPNDGKKY